MTPTVESMREGDAAAQHALSRQAFNAPYPFDPEMPVPASDRIVCAYDGDRLVGAVVTLDFEMTWRGTSIPCGGVSGVAVGPEDRGHGVARRLLVESLGRMRDRGEVLAALYPTTASLYRSVGFEIVGWYAWRRLRLDVVDPSPADALDWARAEPGDPAVRTVHEAMARRHEGWFCADDVWWGRQWRRIDQDERTNRFVYIGRRAGEPVAALAYHYADADERLYDIALDLLAGADDDAVGAALGFLGRHGTTVGHVETTAPATLLARHLPQMQFATTSRDWPWMLRLVDAAAAIGQRPVPSSVSGSVSLRVEDAVMQGNDGPAVLEVADGRALLSPGGPGTVPISITDLAVVFGGGDVRGLADAGRLPGASADDLDLLAAAFIAHPTMPFFF